MLSQHSKSQVLVKEPSHSSGDEIWKKFWMNPLSDAPYRSLGMVLNGQGSSRHPFGDVSCHVLSMMLSEQESGHCFLSGALHRHRGVVTHVQRTLHHQLVRRIRKLVEPTMIRLGSWNVGWLTCKSMELVDTTTWRHVNILCIQETK
jgi:hypothetical protein